MKFRHFLASYEELATLLGLEGEIRDIWIEHGSYPQYIHIMVSGDEGYDPKGYIEEQTLSYRREE